MRRAHRQVHDLLAQGDHRLLTLTLGFRLSLGDQVFGAGVGVGNNLVARGFCLFDGGLNLLARLGLALLQARLILRLKRLDRKSVV